MKLSHQFRRQCEKVAAEQRRLLECTAHAPLRGEDLAEHHCIRLCEPYDIPGATNEMASDAVRRTDWDGMLLPAPPNHRPLILLRPGVPSTRRQSTLMHEMGHYLLGHTPITWSDALAKFAPRCPADEQEAAYLGGCLQVPKVGLTWALQTGLTIARTASHFGASESMVRYRAAVTQVALRR